MNKKGFTLIELLAVISIMAIMAVIATPNIINMLNNGKREQYITDAKNFISKAKYRYTNMDKYENYFIDDGSCSLIKLSKLGLSDDKLKDVYGDSYDTDASGVKVCVEAGRIVYKVYVNSTNHCLGTSSSCASYNTPIDEGSLSVDNVLEK